MDNSVSPWRPCERLDAHTGLPELNLPIDIQWAEMTRSTLGDPRVTRIATEAVARVMVISSREGLLAAQVRDAGVVLARAEKTTRYEVERRIYALDDGIEAAWLESVLRFPVDKEPENIELEIAAAMVTLWHSWWITDEGTGAQGLDPFVVSRSVWYLNRNTPWQSALTMASLDLETAK